MTTPDAISYNRDDAAAVIGVSTDEIDKARRKGDLCARYLGKKPLFGRDELMRWFDSLPSEPKTA